MNDRDSDALALQAKKFPDAVKVITGRFERNPPLFYEMRIARAKADLAKNPDQWGLYDDVAVACDRIRQDSEAIQWMDKKRRRLPAFDKRNPEVKEAWYRFFANDGTFWVHRWLHDGAKVERIAELRRAQKEIARAIEIKPNAHFGREKYQLQALQWIEREKLHRPNPGNWASDRLSVYLEDKDAWEDDDGEDPTPNLNAGAQGLSGLVVLGAAWESPDLFEALAYSLNSSTGNGLSYLALLRTQELLKAGKHSVCPELNGFVDKELKDPKNYGLGNGLDNDDFKEMRHLYPLLRREAEQWSVDRTSFMVTRLQAGRHPDWDKHFWDGYKELPAPALDMKWMRNKNGWELATAKEKTALVLVLGVPFLCVLWAAYGAFRRWRADP